MSEGEGGVWCEKHVTREGKPICVVCGGIDWSLVPDPVPPEPPKPSPTARFREWPKPIEWYPAPDPLGERVAAAWNPHIVHEESGFGPVGTIVGWATGAEPMAGAVPCDGRMLSVKDYPDLAAVLGTTYGGAWAGDGETVVAIAVPDLRGSSMTGRVPPPRTPKLSGPSAEKILDEMSKDEVKHLTFEDVMREMREIKGMRVTRREIEGRWLD